MIHHVVVWTLKNPADQARFIALLETCRGIVPGMRQFTLGGRADPQPAGMEGNVDVVLVSQFDSVASLQAYQVHPQHRAVVAQIGPLRTTRQVLDWAD